MSVNNEIVKKMTTDDVAMSRRNFVVIGVSSIAVCGLGASIFGYEFLSPNVLYEPSPVVNVGRQDRFTADTVTLLADVGIYVVRAAQGFYALSAVCTHLGCLTAWKPDLNIIACPCHGSKFERNGTKIAGPAPNPLPWLHLWINDDGEVMVDRSTTAPANQFIKTWA